MTQLQLLSATDARLLTDQVRTDAADLWSKLLRLYEGKAHIALGYQSWGSYFEAEFGQTGARGYQLLEAARVKEALADSTIVERLTESQARELRPLLDNPPALQEAVALASQQNDGHPTAAVLHDAVVATREGFEIARRGLGVHFSSETEEWETPQDLFDQLDAEFSFEVDVCATAENAKCDTYFDRESNGLSQRWLGVCWMNPPYGDVIGAWMAKAHDAGERGATVVCLVPARTDTNWWWDHARYGEVRFLKGRLRFVGADSSAPFPSAVVIFGRPACVKWWER